MPKLYDGKRQQVSKLFDMIGSKCIIIDNNQCLNDCTLCDDKYSSLYRCIKCRVDLCQLCMKAHIIKENKWYECEICESVFNDKNDLEWIDGSQLIPQSKDAFFLCKECTVRSKSNKNRNF